MIGLSTCARGLGASTLAIIYGNIISDVGRLERRVALKGTRVVCPLLSGEQINGYNKLDYFLNKEYNDLNSEIYEFKGLIACEEYEI